MKLTPHNNNLTPQGAQEISESLDTFLSDFQIYHQNIRQIHWDKQLRLHFDLNGAIGPLYQSADASTQVVAERIMELGYKPTATVSQALIQTQLEPVYEIHSFEEAIRLVIRNSQQLLQVAREVFDIAVKYNDQRTIHLLSHLGKYLAHTIQHFTALRMARMN